MTHDLVHSGLNNDGQNILHALVRNRKLEDGTGTLHIDELQSDLHQKGSKLGYAPPREEIQKAQQMQQAIQANPQNQQLIQEATQLTNTVNARKAVLIAEMTKDYMNEEEQLTGGLGGDPLIKLKAREVDLRAQENKRKEDEGQERINIDKMKAMMNQSQHEDKLEQNEDLAELRADTSLTKQIMADESKKHDFGRNFRKK